MQQRTNGTKLIFAGVGIIVLVLGLGFFAFNRGNGSGGHAASTTQPVLVALQAIPQGTTFQAGEPLTTFFGTRDVPKSIVPFGAYTSVNQVSSLIRSEGCQPVQVAGCRGQVTASQTIYQNLPVVAGMFSTLGQFRQSAGPAFQIPYGYVAQGVTFSDVNSVIGSVNAGDDIDLIASFIGAEGNSKFVPDRQTQYVLNDLRVIGVGGPPATPSGGATSSAVKTAQQTTSGSQAGGSLLLLVRYQQALIIQHLKDFGGSWTMSVVLRSSKETDIPHFKTLPVNIRWYFAKQENHFEVNSPY